jgi:hypothetical protein
MLFYIVGKISNKSTIESGIRSPFDLTAFRTSVATNYGGVYTDYFVYSIDETTADAVRVKNGDDWTAVWTGNAITGVSFSTEDSKKWLEVSADRVSLMADGKESALIKVSVLTANKSGTDTSFVGTIDIPMSTPEGQKAVQFRFIGGRASRSIKAVKSGVWLIPSQKVSGYRNNNSVTINSIE